MKKKATSVSQLDFISPLDFSDSINEATASILKANPTVTWAKIVITDDKPNENKQRIPIEEFENIKKSAINMPIKMAEGEIKDGHDDAVPLGVITNIKQEGNRLIALAALWGAERPSDVEYIKSLIKDGIPVNVSWELLYGEASEREDGVVDLRDITFKASTIVGLPAYAGRTPIVAIASRGRAKPRKWGSSYINKLPDKNFLYVAKDHRTNEKIRLFPYIDAEGNVDTRQLKKVISETANSDLPEPSLVKVRRTAKKILDTLNSAQASVVGDSPKNDMEDINLDALEELKKEIAEWKDRYEDIKEKFDLASKDLETKEKALAKASDDLKELEELRQFKEAVEAEKARIEKLEAIRQKFADAGIEKDDEYFEANAERLLNMDDEALEFLVQELIAFANTKVENSGEASKAAPLPNFISNESGDLDIKGLAKALKELKK